MQESKRQRITTREDTIKDTEQHHWICLNRSGTGLLPRCIQDPEVKYSRKFHNEYDTETNCKKLCQPLPISLQEKVSQFLDYPMLSKLTQSINKQKYRPSPSQMNLFQELRQMDINEKLWKKKSFKKLYESLQDSKFGWNILPEVVFQNGQMHSALWQLETLHHDTNEFFIEILKNPKFQHRFPRLFHLLILDIIQSIVEDDLTLESEINKDFLKFIKSVPEFHDVPSMQLVLKRWLNSENLSDFVEDVDENNSINVPKQESSPLQQWVFQNSGGINSLEVVKTVIEEMEKSCKVLLRFFILLFETDLIPIRSLPPLYQTRIKELKKERDNWFNIDHILKILEEAALAKNNDNDCALYALAYLLTEDKIILTEMQSERLSSLLHDENLSIPISFPSSVRRHNPGVYWSGQ